MKLHHRWHPDPIDNCLIIALFSPSHIFYGWLRRLWIVWPTMSETWILCLIPGDNPATQAFQSSNDDPYRFIQKAPNASKTWICTLCGFNRAGRCQLVRHVTSVHLKLDFTCQYCKKSFTQADHRQSHMRRDHGLSLKMFEIEQMARQFGLPR